MGDVLTIQCGSIDLQYGPSDRDRVSTGTGLSFDDVLLVPQRNRIASRRDADTSMQFTPAIRLNIPVVSANTPWCTGERMAIAMARAGGIGIVHRMFSPAEQAAAVVATKKADPGGNPRTTVDSAGRLRVGGAVGIKGDYLDRARLLVESEVDFLAMILWALGAVGALPAPDEQCDTAVFQEKLPPFAPISVSDFLATAKLRSPSELIAMADDTLALHWEARDARRLGRASEPNIEMEIIQERHHAINWIIGYDGLDWDDVTTDT